MMFVWVYAADVAPLRDSKSYMIVYAVVFFFASAAQSHLYYVQDPNAHVVGGGWYLSCTC